MSKIEYTDDDKVISRKGEFYRVGSCYTTPRSVHPIEELNDPIFAALELDVDELTNKPRRFFDHLLSIMEYKRDHDPKREERKEYWDYIIEGCELWLSVVNQGLYAEVLRLAERTDGKVWNEEEGKYA